MTNLPRRRIEPLEPPPESFDRVLAGARRRRRQHALVAASSTLVLVLVAAGSFALGSSLNATQNLNDAADGKHNGDSTSHPTLQSSRTPSIPSSKHTQTPPTGTQTSQGQGQGQISWLRGRAVDPNGNGIAGLYVLTGEPNQQTFNSDGAAGTRTDSNGDYKIACPRAPVLLATWQLGTELQAMTTGGQWGATFVGGAAGSTSAVVPACDKPRIKTTLSPGGSVHGIVHVTGKCAPGATFPLWVWLGGDRNNTVRLGGLQDGDAFSFAGLPPGTHTLGARGVTASITLHSGSSVEQDAAFKCRDSTTPSTDESPDPSSSPSPTESSTPPATPSSTPSPTVS
jgi:hypothetical protein